MKSLYESIFDIDDNVENIVVYGELLEKSYKNGELIKSLKDEIIRNTKVIQNPINSRSLINKQKMLLVHCEPSEEHEYIYEPYDVIIVVENGKYWYIDFMNRAFRTAYCVRHCGTLHKVLYDRGSEVFYDIDIKEVRGTEETTPLILSILEKIKEIDKR
jgi:hypothetical protein